VGMYRYSDEEKCYKKEEDKKEDRKECKKEDHCDSESARALKKILSLIDDLNNGDLRILEDIVERLLCSRSKDF